MLVPQPQHRRAGHTCRAPHAATLAALALTTLALTALTGGCPPAAPLYTQGNDRARLTTPYGDIVIELAGQLAPQSVANFKQYAGEGYYDGTLFHRVVPGFVIQGGGYTAGLVQKETGAPVANESANGRTNTRGAVALAFDAADDPQSATAQLVLNAAANPALDPAGQTPGHAVFATLVAGLDTLDEIVAVATQPADALPGVPVEDIVLTAAARETTAAGAPVRVRITTTLGDLVLELDEAAAPLSVANFLQYVDAGYYAGTLVSHVAAGQYAVAGGYVRGPVARPPTHSPVPSEAGNGLPNARGTVGLARTADVNSATSQFYINVADNAALNGSLDAPGYTVFGLVIEGMDIVDQIAALERTTIGGLSDVPVENVVITRVVIEPGGDEVTPEWEQWLAGADYNLRSGARTVLVDLLTRVLTH